jgi:integrase
MTFFPFVDQFVVGFSSQLQKTEAVVACAICTATARSSNMRAISAEWTAACRATKGGIESVHPLHGPELRALRPLQGASPYVFVTEAGTWFLRMVQRTGKAAKLPFPVHPHMLRHSTGYKLANDGHDTRSLAHYLAHRNLQSAARYTCTS